jgi:hypothetical protein
MILLQFLKKVILVIAFLTITTFVGLCIIGFEKLEYLIQSDKSICYTYLSMFFFSFGTLCKLGWRIQTFGGQSFPERMDSIILWVCYGLGMCFGTCTLIM